MITGTCPTCRRPFREPDLDAIPHFPFCSERCRLVDLGRWIDGDYAIPGPTPPPDAAEDRVEELE